VIVGPFVKVVEKRKRVKEEAHTIALVVIAIEARADFACMANLGIIRRPSVPVEYLCIFIELIEHMFFHLYLPSLHTLSCL
jgi:hypothetical protein